MYLLFNATDISGQSFFRIESEISIKTKEQGGQGTLNLGKVYYDKNVRKLVYTLTFPENEVWVVKDSLSLVYRDHELQHSGVINPFVETTVFHKCLEGNLNDFGLKGSIYQIDKVERDSNMVITTWIPPSHLKDHLGHILTSTVNNNLYGVVIKNASGEVLSRQIYKNYILAGGLRVPSEIIQIMFKDGSEIYQVINLSNIIVNSFKDENMYNYPAASN